MSTRSSANISPLHHQRVRGRHILLTEFPRFHVVWYYDTIFVKPLPRYLLSHAFWRLYLLSPKSPLGQSREAVLQAALGMVRTYCYLCQYESDLRIAQAAGLIPDDISWPEFCRYIDGFRYVSDEDVSLRYNYGELRLSRLNLWSKVFLHRTYQQLEAQLGSYVAKYYGPWIVIFAVLSVILSALQVVLSTGVASSGLWPAFVTASRYIGIVALAIVAFAILLLVFVVCFRFMKELLWTIHFILRGKKKQPSSELAQERTISVRISQEKHVT